MQNNIKDILNVFLNQSKTSNLKTSHFPNIYSDLKLKISFGQGNSARIPWISFLGGNQTTSNGIYPVYLFFKDQNKLILSYGISETIVPLSKWNLNATTIKEYFNSIGVKPDRYGNSYVYKSYEIEEIDWNEIENDLNGIIEEYKEILKNANIEKVEGVVVCDNTGWLQNAIIELEDYENIVLWWDKSPTGGQDVLNQLNNSINNSPNKCFYIYYSTNQIATFRATVKDFAFENDFSSKKWNNDNKTGWYFSDFNEYNSEKNKGNIISAKILFLVDKIEKLDKPVRLKNFNFYKHYQTPTQNNMQPYSSIISEEKLNINVIPNKLELYCISIKTKPFIILAGLSGTGKSRLVRSLAYQFNNIEEDKTLKKYPPSNFKLIKVKPNWHDSSELLGYESRISGKDKYIVTEFMCFIAEAWKHPHTPFFLCLDEMNLAPVEQYFAEYLSVIETREVKESGAIVTDCLVSATIIKKYTGEKAEDIVPTFDLWKELNITEEGLKQQLLANGLCLPSNLIVIGTVNMDETTHSFSRKVLDRAMTIEMNDINLSEGLTDEGNAWDYPDEPLSAQFVLSEKTHGYQVFSDLGATGQTVIAYLEEVNTILEKSPFKIAYRVRDEFLLYVYNYDLIEDKSATWITDALDNMTLMKILPRIEGDDHKTSVLDPLIDLLTSYGLQASLKKANEMIEKRNTYHYTSFWS